MECLGVIRVFGQGGRDGTKEDASGGLVPDSDTGEEEQGDAGSWLLEAVGSRRRGVLPGCRGGREIGREEGHWGLAGCGEERTLRGKPLLFKKETG